MNRLTAVALGLLLILLPSPAYAAPDPPPFTLAPCVQATFGDVTWDPDAEVLVLNGSATQCGPVVENGGFYFATYLERSPLGYSESYNRRWFSAPVEGDVRTFGVAAIPVTRGNNGVCLISGAGRTVCARFSTTRPPDGPPTVVIAPLAVNDPLVNKLVLARPYAGETGPPSNGSGTCGTCF